MSINSFHIITFWFVFFNLLTPKLYSQKNSFSANFETMPVPSNPELFDNRYDWTEKSISSMGLIFLGIEKNIKKPLSVGFDFNFSRIFSFVAYRPNFPSPGSGSRIHYNIHYFGMRSFIKLSKPFKSANFHWKNSLTYFHHLSSIKKLTESATSTISQNFDSQYINKGAFYLSTQLGMNFPLFVKFDSIKIQGEFGLLLNMPINDFFKNDSSRFLFQGLCLGLKIVFIDSD